MSSQATCSANSSRHSSPEDFYDCRDELVSSSPEKNCQAISGRPINPRNAMEENHDHVCDSKGQVTDSFGYIVDQGDPGITLETGLLICESWDEVRPKFLLRTRTRVWSASANPKGIFTPYMTGVLRPTQTIFFDNTDMEQVVDETVKLGHLCHLVKPTYRLHSRPPPFTVTVPTTQSLIKQLTVHDCPEILASTPYLGLHLLCKRLDVASFEPLCCDLPSIKVPLSIIEYIDKKLGRERPLKLLGWMIPVITNSDGSTSRTPVFDLLKRRAITWSVEKGVITVDRVALEDMAMNLAACWPERTPQDDFAGGRKY